MSVVPAEGCEFVAKIRISSKIWNSQRKISSAFNVKLPKIELHLKFRA